MRCTMWIISRLGKERYSNRMNSFPVWSNNNTVMHAIVVIVVLCEHHRLGMQLDRGGEADYYFISTGGPIGLCLEIIQIHRACLINL